MSWLLRRSHIKELIFLCAHPIADTLHTKLRMCIAANNIIESRMEAYTKKMAELWYEKPPPQGLNSTLHVVDITICSSKIDTPCTNISYLQQIILHDLLVTCWGTML